MIIMDNLAVFLKIWQHWWMNLSFVNFNFDLLSIIFYRSVIHYKIDTEMKKYVFGALYWNICTKPSSHLVGGGDAEF